MKALSESPLHRQNNETAYQFVKRALPYLQQQEQKQRMRLVLSEEDLEIFQREVDRLSMLNELHADLAFQAEQTVSAIRSRLAMHAQEEPEPQFYGMKGDDGFSANQRFVTESEPVGSES